MCVYVSVSMSAYMCEYVCMCASNVCVCVDVSICVCQ